MISYNEKGTPLVDGESCIYTTYDNISEYSVNGSGYVIKVIEEGEEITASVTESFNYEMSDGKLKLSYPGRNEGTIKLRYNINSDTITLNDSVSRTATLAGIAAAVFVYVILIFAIKAISTDDVRLLPKGAKIEKLLRKVKLLK